jgi:hypothetical protein
MIAIISLHATTSSVFPYRNTLRTCFNIPMSAETAIKRNQFVIFRDVPMPHRPAFHVGRSRYFVSRSTLHVERSSYDSSQMHNDKSENNVQRRTFNA